MIERLIISRFRGIRKGVLKDLGKFNLIVGPNNSGKTAVLEALYWLSICGRKCSFLSKKLTEFPDDSKDESDDKERKFPLAFVSINKDLMGYSPCPRLWERHGKADSWEESGGNVSEDGTLSYKIKDVKEDDFLKDFRLIPPQTKEIGDIEKFKPDDEKSICLFVLDNPIGMEDLLKYYFRDMPPDAFSYPEDKMRRFAFTWFPDFIYLKRSLGAWGIEGITADSDCVLFYDFHTTSEHFTDEFYKEVLKRGIERRLKEYFSEIFRLDDLGDFDVSIQHYPDSNGAIQGIIKPAGMPSIPIDDFGDGARHAFKVLAALTVLVERCKDGKEGIFLWEDPELFMHPDSMYRLLTQIMDIVQDKPIQIFICTQSLEFIALYTKLIKERLKLRDDSRVFRLDIMDGELVTALSTYGKLKGWLETGWDPRFWNQMDTLFHYRIDIENEDDMGE